jgi:S-layer homology domain
MAKWRNLLLTFAGASITVAVYSQPLASAPLFGTTNTTFVSFSPPEFNPVEDTDSYFRGFYLTAKSGSGTFHATPHLPTGALLTYLELQYCDTNASNQHVSLTLNNCVTVITACDALLPVATVTSASNGCFGTWVDLTPQNRTVANTQQRLFLTAQFEAFDATNQLTGVVVGYRLQVSQPGFQTQTFGDVPPSDPFYQYIEALAAAGITSGCGSGNYCPDAALTRGQVAVLLAKALGLSWE